MKFYAGIGSRQTPLDIQARMTQLAATLATRNYCLRSGAANGADAAFELGVPVSRDGSVLKEIYLPWPRFNNHKTGWYRIPDWAFEMAAQHHPNWANLKISVRNLHARNCLQVLGFTREHPSSFILYWTEGGKLVGGTAQALRIAEAHDIPAYWVSSPDWQLPDHI